MSSKQLVKRTALTLAFAGAMAFASFGTGSEALARGCGGGGYGGYGGYGGGYGGHYHSSYSSGYRGYYQPRSYYVAHPVSYGYGSPGLYYRSGGYGSYYGGRGVSFGIGF